MQRSGLRLPLRRRGLRPPFRRCRLRPPFRRRGLRPHRRHRPQLRLQRCNLLALEGQESNQLLDVAFDFGETKLELGVFATTRVHLLDREGKLVAESPDVGVFLSSRRVHGRFRRYDLDPAARLRFGVARRRHGRRGGGSRRRAHAFAILRPRRVLTLQLGDRRLPIVRPELVPARNAQDHACLERVDVPDGECLGIRLQERQHHALDADGIVGPDTGRDRPQRVGHPDGSIAGAAGSGRRGGCTGPGLPFRLRRGPAARGRTARAGGGRSETQPVPPYRAPARPTDLDEERQGRLADRLIRADVDVGASAVLLDDGELEGLENRQPRDPGELELGR